MEFKIKNYLFAEIQREFPKGKQDIEIKSVFKLFFFYLTKKCARMIKELQFNLELSCM